MTPKTFFRVVRRYAGEMQTLRNEIRAERSLNALPADIRKDIGWPTRFEDRGPIRF